MCSKIIINRGDKELLTVGEFRGQFFLPAMNSEDGSRVLSDGECLCSAPIEKYFERDKIPFKFDGLDYYITLFPPTDIRERFKQACAHPAVSATISESFARECEEIFNEAQEQLQKECDRYKCGLDVVLAMLGSRDETLHIQAQAYLYRHSPYAND